MHSHTFLTRSVPDTYDRCVRSNRESIDVARAQKQHAAYCAALDRLGGNRIEIASDDRFPDCCFVEDPVVILGVAAIICRMGAESRRGEEEALERFFRDRKEIFRIEPPGTLEGGDVLQIGPRLYIGLTSRTNRAGFEQLAAIAACFGYTAIAVETRDLFHLKSDITCIAPDTVLLRPGRFDQTPFAGYRKIIVPEKETYAANCLAIGDAVLVSRGYPATLEKLNAAGLKTIALEMSEFRKGDGSLTCLSKIY